MARETKTELSHELIRALHDVMIAFRNCARRKLQAHEYDLSPEQVMTLMALHHHDGITMSRLSDKCGRDKTTTTRMIDGLERLGLVDRVPGQKDRRKIRLFLNNKGRKRVKDIRLLNPDLGTVVSKYLTVAELRTTLGTLRKAHEALCEE